MADESFHDPDESRMARLLRAADAGAAPPDRQRLAEIGDRAAAAFSESKSQVSPAPKSGSFKSRRSMTSLLLRGVAALVVVGAVTAAWLQPWSPDAVSDGAAFSQVLDELRKAQTLHLRVVKDGEPAEVWIRAPGLVRWESSPQQYRIAAGSRLWEVDEAANTVRTHDSPWFRSSDQQIDLLALLDLEVEDAGALLAARPAEKAVYQGRESLVYRVDLPAQDGAIQIEAFADAKTNALQAIIARPIGTHRDAGPPLAELHLVAMNEEVADARFLVSKTLTEDGRIGKVTDAQGIVTIRPLLARRWTPICRELPLKPGDWLRTELRGANAVKATLASGVEITLGPGSLLECIEPTQVRLHRGEAQARVPSKDDASLELLAPQDGRRKFSAGKYLVRIDRNEKLVDVAQPPLWLQGFEGTTANESLGSLIVNLPDGRNEPLTVGYHKVSVEIRDQIARTTIEESFVNHTPARLEGIFHFPLPADASISGFGMWIGNDLIEADVVEKQRAREIYETILRERRDPGLLEWTGGNLFKAQVFPIEAHSEKRIKIVYTQVLPLRAGRYRYSYGLRSELLRTRPLRELSLMVTVNSATPLKSIDCPTHSARIQQTAHSGQVEFAAQEYAPDRDFEVVCELEDGAPEVVVIPHRRGEDGYLLVQLSPPAGEGALERELLSDGKPLNVVLLCDTSASMEPQKRREQQEFVATVLASLDEKDRFQVAAADVGTAWAFPEPVAATAENIVTASKFLEERLSLGWTNLERAFTDVLKKVPANAHIVYIGDGIVSAGESDPPGFVKLLDRISRDASASGISRGALAPGSKKPGNTEPGASAPRLVHENDADANHTFHAVTVGNVYEATVLQGIAEVGGGSVRRIGGEQTPQIVASELLNEITRPGLEDLNVEFRGLKVAAVYPGRLPNVPAGTQQILVGRYLPEGQDQVGDVVVTGMRGGEIVRYAARVQLKDAEEGNSFIPRLWARSHLDHLLQQGTSEAIQNEIIALSEEFHIITPYTSLLVLETDADRERFGVKRRYEMRDGERFFAQGRDNANYELLQQQMKRAGDWRLGLRRQVLRFLATLGRNPQLFQQQVQMLDHLRRSGVESYDMPGLAGAAGPAARPEAAAATWFDISGGGGGEFSGELAEREVLAGDKFDLAPQESKKMESLDEGLLAEEDLSLGMDSRSDRDLDGAELWDMEQANSPMGGAEPMFKRLEERSKSAEDFFSSSTLFGGFGARNSLRKKSLLAESARKPYGGFYDRHYPDYESWLNTVFPSLADPPGKPKPVPAPDGWSPEAVELSKSLLRTEALSKINGGIELRRMADTFDPRWDRRSSHNRDLVLFAPKAWLARTLDPEDHAIVEYCDAEHRGVFSLALLLGRERASTEEELKAPPLGLLDLSLAPLFESYRYHQARVEPAGEDRARLVLSMKDSTYELYFLIDTARNVVLTYQTLEDGKVTATTTFDDFVEVAGSWWARKVTIQNAKGETIGENTYDVKALTPEEFAGRMNMELAPKTDAQLLHLPLPDLRAARQKTADGSAGFEDRLVMVLYNAYLQQWDELLKHLDAAEKLAADKPGVRWLRTVLLGVIRRNEEARQRLVQEARDLAGERNEHEIYLADLILSQAQSVASSPELKEFVDLLEPVYNRQPEGLDVKSRWQNYLLAVYEGLGRKEEALALRRAMAEDAPWEQHRQTEYARQLSYAGRLDEAFAWLRKELDREVDRNNSDDEPLRSALADLYRTHARWSELLEFTAEWIAIKPEYESPYQQHLAALVCNDRLDEANALAERWLEEGRIEGKLSRDQRARLDAAIAFAQGSAHFLSFQRMDERWHEPLTLTARFFLRHKHHGDVVQRIFAYRFSETEAGDRLRGHFLSLLQSALEKLSPQQISFVVPHAISGRLELEEPINGRKQVNASEIPDAVWKKIADELRPRWAAAEDKHEKHTLGAALATIYATRFSNTEHLPFLRERIKTAPEEYKLGYISALFDVLLARPWSEEIEREAFQVLRQLSDAEQPVMRLSVEVPALYRLVDAMIVNRQSAGERELLDAGEVNQLTRPELLSKRAEIRKSARSGLAARLAEEAAEEEGPLAPWLQMEQAWLDIGLEQNLKATEERCWAILGESPQEVDEDELEELTPEQFQERAFDALLRHRALVTVMNLASRRSAAEETVERVRKYLDGGIALEGEQAEAWRATRFQFLVARDEPEELERELRAWIRNDISTAPWRMMLARLVAERGKIDEAIQLFEAAEKDKLLTAPDYRVLADWYLVADRREAYERSRIEAFKQAPEHVLSNFMYQIRNRWYRTDIPLPSELDENTLFAFRALFEKSASPESYLWQLREVYAACRDFRLLAMLPDAVLGRSPQQIYNYLKSLNSQVLHELRNEATADEIISRIEKLREGERTPTDLRALDLLEAMIERRSSEVQNQPGPHVEACLAALRRAFDREWVEGEPRMMAAFLYGLGTLPHPELVEEQIRELRALQRMAPAAGRDHLLITSELSNTLFWSYNRRDEALQEMEIEVRAYEQAHDGGWPHQDNDVLGGYVRMLEGAKRHAAGETVLQNHLAHPEHDQQKQWLEDRLLMLYNDALEQDGAVSLGSGGRLFHNVVAFGLKLLDAAPDENARHNLVSRLLSTYETAHRRKLPGVEAALSKFAFNTIPLALQRQQGQYRNTATAPVSLLSQVLGPKTALEYIVERMEQYPQRFEIAWDNAWNAFGHELARYRHEAAQQNKDLTDLNPRVLKIAISEIKRDLRTGESRNPYIHHNDYNYFWAEKADEFARAAEEVYQERKDSGRRVLSIAHYLWHGLDRRSRAIEMLLTAHRDRILDESGQEQLVSYLQLEERYGESISLLEALIESRPDVMRYRAQLMAAYYHTQRPQQLRQLLGQTDEHFHQEGRWTESNIAELAAACLVTELHKESVAYFNEAISLYQRRNPGAGAGDGTLSSWYQQLAQAHSHLGQTKEAVDAASAAIVSWGARQTERSNALAALQNVLENAKDLDDYVKHLDAEAEKTGADSAILRKAIGQVYHGRGEHAKAVAQLQVAVELQPLDKEVQQALMNAYDALGHRDEATRQLVKLIDVDRHNLALYQQLAERMQDNEAEAERAATSIIEADPHEAENHAALAELRQKQDRWDEAIPHWEQVADLRRLEPTGLLKLAEAQIHQKQWDAARDAINKLHKTEWPSRFSDVQNQTRRLQEQLPK